MYKNMFVLFAAILIGSLFLEIFCRHTGKFASYTERIGTGGPFRSPFEAYNNSWYYNIEKKRDRTWQQNEFRQEYVTNNEGFRDNDFIVRKNKFRIMVIGDSFTQGVGSDRDSSLPRQLDYIIRDSLSLVSEVWNCGVSGSDLVYEFRLFHDKLLKYDPDMVLLVVNSSDFNDVITKGGFERFLPDSTVHYKKAPWYMPLYERSFAVRHIVHDVCKYNWQYLSPSQVPYAQSEALKILISSIDSFTEVCTRRHIKLLIAVHPTRGEANNTVINESLPLLHSCRQKHLPCVDVKTSLFKMGWDSANVNTLYWPQDGHCNNKGYHCFAEAIWPQMKVMLSE